MMGITLKTRNFLWAHMIFVVFSALAALFAQGALGQERPRPVRPRPYPLPLEQLSAAELNLQKANAEFRKTVISSMQEAAVKFGHKIRTTDLVAIPFKDNVIAVNAAIEASEKITIEEMKSKGADLLFAFVSLPEKSQLPSGFYTVKIYFNQRSNKWIAQWKNVDGRVVLETEAVVEPQSPDRTEALKQQPMCTLGPKGELILFDEHDPFKNIATSLQFRRDAGTVPALTDPLSQKIVNAANKFLTTARRGVPEMLIQRGKMQRDEVGKITIVPISVGPLSENLTLQWCTWGPKPEWCACDLYQKGPNYYYWWCRGIISGALYGYILFKD